MVQEVKSDPGLKPSLALCTVALTPQGTLTPEHHWVWSFLPKQSSNGSIIFIILMTCTPFPPLHMRCIYLYIIVISLGIILYPEIIFDFNIPIVFTGKANIIFFS